MFSPYRMEEEEPLPALLSESDTSSGSDSGEWRMLYYVTIGVSRFGRTTAKLSLGGGKSDRAYMFNLSLRAGD